MKIEHIAIAVKNIDQANQLFTSLLGTSPYKIEDVPTEAVRTSFFQSGDVKIELLEASQPQSPVAKFIQNRGEGIHHIAFEVENIKEEMNRLKREGFQPLHDQPKPGADNKLICFFHPKSTNHVLIELCQTVKEEKGNI